MSKANIFAHCRTQLNVQFIHIYDKIAFCAQEKNKNKKQKHIQRPEQKCFDCGPNDFLAFNASNLRLEKKPKVVLANKGRYCMIQA